MAAISIRDVVKRYGKGPKANQVIHGVSAEIADGEFIVIVGPSGCGKSTLLRMVAGLEEISGGDISIAGRVVNDIEPAERDIAMVFQNYALYPHMSVFDNMAYGLKIAKVPVAEIKTRVDKAAAILQLGPFLARKPRELSGGQRQRVAMGRALARDPAVFLFDEPLSNLDAKLRVEMRAEIKALHQRLGSTIDYDTHDQVEAMTLGDRIAVMKDGLVQQLGTPEQVYERPSNLYVAGFIGSPTMNLLPVRLQAHDGQWQATLSTACGSAPVSLGPVGAGQWHGRDLVLGLRPEHFREAQPGALGAFELQVELLEPTGADTFAFADINTRRAALRLPPKRIRAAGERLWVALDAAAACLFDPATEQRITL
jgi:multiple sugar transport system ATP-binding protein